MARPGLPAPISPAVLAALLQPPSLTGWLDDAGAALTASDLSQLLTAAGQRIPGLGDLMAWPEHARGRMGCPDHPLRRRRRPAARRSARYPGGNRLGAGRRRARGSAGPDPHLTTLAGLLPAPGSWDITGPHVLPWPDGTIPTLDLSMPGLPDTAFDTSALAAATGPWHVRLPLRADCPGPDRRPGPRPAQPGSPGRSTPWAACGSSVLLVSHGPAAAARPGWPRPAPRSPGSSCSARRMRQFRWTFSISRRWPMHWRWPAGCCRTTPRATVPTWRPHVPCSACSASYSTRRTIRPPTSRRRPACRTWPCRPGRCAGRSNAATLTRAFGALVRAGLGAFQPGTRPPGNPGAPAPGRGARRAPAQPAAARARRDQRPGGDIARCHGDAGHRRICPRWPACCRRRLPCGWTWGSTWANGWLAGGPQGARHPRPVSCARPPCAARTSALPPTWCPASAARARPSR